MGRGLRWSRERLDSRGRVISQGIKELQEGTRVGEGRVRRKGGGRKSNVSKDPGLSEDLERLVEPVTRGDPESPLRWTSKSVRKLAKELQHLGHQVSHELVSELLHGLGYSLQGNRKTRDRLSFTQIATPSLNSSTRQRATVHSNAGQPAGPGTRKRRKRSEISRTAGRSGSPRESPKMCVFTTS